MKAYSKGSKQLLKSLIISMLSLCLYNQALGIDYNEGVCPCLDALKEQVQSDSSDYRQVFKDEVKKRGSISVNAIGKYTCWEDGSTSIVAVANDAKQNGSIDGAFLRTSYNKLNKNYYCGIFIEGDTTNKKIQLNLNMSQELGGDNAKKAYETCIRDINTLRNELLINDDVAGKFLSNNNQLLTDKLGEKFTNTDDTLQKLILANSVWEIRRDGQNPVVRYYSKEDGFCTENEVKSATYINSGTEPETIIDRVWFDSDNDAQFQEEEETPYLTTYKSEANTYRIKLDAQSFNAHARITNRIPEYVEKCINESTWSRMTQPQGEFTVVDYHQLSTENTVCKEVKLRISSESWLRSELSVTYNAIGYVNYRRSPKLTGLDIYDELRKAQSKLLARWKSRLQRSRQENSFDQKRPQEVKGTLRTQISVTTTPSK